MNCASRILPHLRDRAARTALWTLRDGRVSFAEFGELAASAQRLVTDEGLVAGDAALVLAKPGVRLFATVAGLIALGVTVIFVEPWMPVEEIDQLLALVRPGLFIGSTLAQLWGLRVRGVRQVRCWMNLRRVGRVRAHAPLLCEDVDPSAAAVVTFTSGTTGRPKGVVRTHQSMWDTHDILTGLGGGDDADDGPDLCVLPNLALLQLGTGRGAVLVPDDWSPRGLAALEALPADLRSASLTCGPAFLLALLRGTRPQSIARSLRSVHVGGALTDRWIFEHGFARWPDARWTHVYGGTEAEPVAYGDARECVTRSAERGYFQTLNVGRPIPQIRTAPSADGLWVSGPNVAPRYIGEDARGSALRRVDASGRLWHCMGDRIDVDDAGFWFAGRASQPADDFALEQRIYTLLGTSSCFVHRDARGDRWLYGEGLRARSRAEGISLETTFPELSGVREARIVRDRRHRARIDRAATVARSRARAA
ncbi:MAG: hypothetical protein NVS9B3_07050 [Gemmatimonadaceae bacterium]